jgi:hypothetical protein
MSAVQVGQTYHHRRVKDYSCQTYAAVSRRSDSPNANYVLYSETAPLMMRRHLSPQSWHTVEECPYGNT